MHPNLPHEIILSIFTNLKDDTAARGTLNVDLFSCAVVCRAWYQCAWPYIGQSKGLSHLKNLQVQKYKEQDLERLAEVFSESRRYGLGLGRLVEGVEIVAMRFIRMPASPPDMLNRPLANAVRKLLSTLQPYPFTLTLNFRYIAMASRIDTVRELFELLAPSLMSVTALRVFHLFVRNDSTTQNTDLHPLVPTFLRTLRVLATPILGAPVDPNSLDPETRSVLLPHPLNTLITRISPQLEDIHFFNSDLTPDLAQSLRSCPHVHTARFFDTRFHLSADTLAATISAWPRLNTLTIRQPKQLPPLTPTLTLLARGPPPPLTSLELHDIGPYKDTSALASLVLATSQTLNSLSVPSLHQNPTDSEAFLAFLATLNLPVLQTLDLSRTQGLASGKGLMRARECDPTGRLPWPALRTLVLAHCPCVLSRFIELVVRSCPKLRVVCVAWDVVPTTTHVLHEAGFKEERNVDPPPPGDSEIWYRDVVTWRREMLQVAVETV